jgi:hypothetical protein
MLKVSLCSCLLLLGFYFGSCSQVANVNSEIIARNGVAPPNTNSSLDPKKSPTPNEEEVLFDGKNYLKKSGWRIPRLDGRREVVQTSVEAMSSQTGKDVDVTTKLYSYDEPIVYSLNFSSKRSELDDFKGNLETPWFRELSLDGKIFRYIIFAKVIKGSLPSNREPAEERYEYLLQDDDGDGVFETFIYKGDIKVPAWVFK